jgi:hypothetical protein
MEESDILKLINGAGFVAVPMIAAFFGLDWYFTRANKSTRWTFIAVGGILSAVLYSYLAWTEPEMVLVHTSILWYFALAAVAVVVYYGLYTGYHGSADSAPGWVLPVALLSYVCLLSAIGIFCAAALARHDYLLLGGRVSAACIPVHDAMIILQDSHKVTLRQANSDSYGEYLLTLKYKDYDNDKTPPDEKPANVLVKANGYEERNIPFDGHPNENFNITLTPISH